MAVIITRWTSRVRVEPTAYLPHRKKPSAIPLSSRGRETMGAD